MSKTAKMIKAYILSVCDGCVFQARGYCAASTPEHLPAQIAEDWGVHVDLTQDDIDEALESLRRDR